MRFLPHAEFDHGVLRQEVKTLPMRHFSELHSVLPSVFIDFH